jgi:thymidylate kinase
MSPDAANSRMNRPLDRMESQGDAYRKRLHDGFRAEIAHWGDQVQVIDADRPVDAIQADIWGLAIELLKQHRDRPR